LSNTLVQPDRRDPNGGNQLGGLSDDDGRTMSFNATQALTSEATNQQLVFATHYEMLTQDGAQEDRSKNRRADLLTNILQYNQRFDLGSGVQFYAGVGAGIQTSGDIGGLQLQEWFHTELGKGFGGRTQAGGLQNNFATEGSQTAPAFSAGVGITAQTRNEQGWFAEGSAQLSGVAGLGSQGASSAQFGVGAKAGLENVFSLSAGAQYSLTAANGSYLQFAPIGEAQLGGTVRLQIDALKLLGIPVSPFVMYQNNSGGYADTQYTIGFVIGTGSGAWLAPPK
jgi:hypothetical protein